MSFRRDLGKAFVRDAFTKVMRENCVDGHYRLLPSEAAAMVGEKFGITPDAVLLSFLPDPT